VNILIYNFDAINPLAHEWAHILVDLQSQVTVVNHRESIKCRDKRVTIFLLDDFKPSIKSNFDLLFLPWIPSRKYFMRFFKDWIKLGLPEIVWIDHNPVQGRDRQGLLLKFLRSSTNVKVRRLVHGMNSLSLSDTDPIYFPHPIFINAFEGSNSRAGIKDPTVMNFAFIGRLDEQKGLFELPRLAEMISKGLNISTKWIIAGNNPDMDLALQIAESIRELPNVTVEAHIYGKKCPDQIIKNTLSKSHFLIAPYNQVTASGTISLALASDTEVVSISKSVPLGLGDFEDRMLHCIKEAELVNFLRSRIGKNEILMSPNLEKNQNLKTAHNEQCGKIFLEFAGRSKVNRKQYDEKQ
jgi:glycosyltransferase involved in cell wall biosynthesis